MTANLYHNKSTPLGSTKHLAGFRGPDEWWEAGSIRLGPQTSRVREEK
jgi:hypothetical protein